MKFNLEMLLENLERTPPVIDTLLRGLSDEWTKTNEGPDTWSPFDIVGHLIHGEKTDWIPRMEIILSTRERRWIIKHSLRNLLKQQNEWALDIVKNLGLK